MAQQSFVIENDNESEPKQNIFHGKKGIIIPIFCIFALLLVIMLNNLRQFHGFTEKAVYKRGDATETTYLGFQGNLLKFSRDGAFYTKYNGELIWNYTYEMDNPRIDICGNYIMIYDLKGTQVAILTNTGFKKKIKTAMPIVDANIANKGTVAILMQEEDTGYVQICNETGDVLASGELHMENSGYPMALDISDGGERMVVSQLDMNGGDVKTTIAFYHFGKEGKDKIDNIIANYSFSNQVFPQVAFLENGKAVAFGDGEIVLFDNDAKAEIAKEIFVDGEIKNVFSNGKYFGIICNAVNKKGMMYDQLSVYSENGIRRCQKEVKDSYTKAELLPNHEVCLTNGRDASIYTLYGIKKFAYTFETGIYKIIPGDSSRRYYFVRDDNITSARLK